MGDFSLSSRQHRTEHRETGSELPRSIIDPLNSDVRIIRHFLSVQFFYFYSVGLIFSNFTIRPHSPLFAYIRLRIFHRRDEKKRGGEQHEKRFAL